MPQPRPRKRLQRVDGRTRQGRFLRRVRRELIDHLGGSDRVTAPQRILVERVAMDLLRLEMLDHEMADGTFSEHDGRVAHALRNSVRLALRELGLKPPAQPPPLAEVLAQGKAEREDAATDDTARRAFAELLKVRQGREREEASPP